MPDPTPTPTEAQLVTALQDCWGALNFILAFYEPGQRYLDTNAWTQAEAGGRRAHANAEALLNALKEDGDVPPG